MPDDEKIMLSTFKGLCFALLPSDMAARAFLQIGDWQQGFNSLLALQVKFGAQTGAAPVVLGCVKLVLGLLLGSSLAELFRAFPQPLLGSLLIFSGACMSSAGIYLMAAFCEPLRCC